MNDYRERVVIERDELDEKLAKLKDFISDNPRFQTLSKDEREALVDQSLAMAMYWRILVRRVEFFSEIPEGV